MPGARMFIGLCFFVGIFRPGSVSSFENPLPHTHSIFVCILYIKEDGIRNRNLPNYTLSFKNSFDKYLKLINTKEFFNILEAS